MLLSILPTYGDKPEPGATTSAAVVAATLRVAAASGSSNNFGAVAVGAPRVQTFVVTNIGTGQTSSRITLSLTTGTGFALVAPGAGECASGTTTLGPGRSCNVRVTFTPAGAGAFSATLGARATTGGTATLGLSGTGAVSCVKPGPEYINQNGSVAFYTFSQGSNGAVQCSYQATSQNPDTIAHVATGNGQYFAALDTDDFAAAKTCGACIEVSRDDGRKVVATVVDECPKGSDPKCVGGHVDLSRNAFLQIGSLAEGFLGKGNTLQPAPPTVGLISWRFVPCPVTGNAFARIKSGNQNEIFFENLVAPIKSATLNGVSATALQPYNAWHFANNITAGAALSVTDIDNSTITFTVASGAQNLDQDTGRPFAMCQ